MEPFTTRPELRGTLGMVASTHWLASAAGMTMLERGGNAFDAAVAAGFVLQVVEPHLNGPGGEVPILLYHAERDEVLVVDGQGTAPAAATIERFRELGHQLVPGRGLLAACVPGAFDAWLLLLRDFGTLPLAEVLEPALGYAENGYPLVPGIPRSIAKMEQVFREEWTGSAELYLPVPEAGTLFRNRALAATYRRVLAESSGEIDAARDAFYRGFVAEAIDAYSREHGGLLDGDDLASWQASVEQPVTRAYEGWEVSKTGAWGQGPVFLQQLALLDGFELGEREGPDFVHTVVECAKLAFADREAWYGDTDVPLDELLSPEYAAERRKLVGDEASGELRPGSPGGREPRLPNIPAGAGRARNRRADPRRHLSRGRGRQLRQRGLGHAERRLAARLARDPRARLLPRDAGADVLAGGGPAELAGASQAPAHDALALARAPRRRDARLRHAGRGPAGSVVARLLPHARPFRAERTGGDRRADVPDRALPGLVLPAAGATADAAARTPLPAADGCGAPAPRSPGRAAGSVVARPRERCGPRPRGSALRGGKPSRHAGLRGRALVPGYWSSFTTPTRLPSGSVNWPRTTMPMMSSGPITRLPPRLSAFCSASSTSGTAT